MADWCLNKEGCALSGAGAFLTKHCFATCPIFKNKKSYQEIQKFSGNIKVDTILISIVDRMFFWQLLMFAYEPKISSSSDFHLQ